MRAFKKLISRPAARLILLLFALWCPAHAKATTHANKDAAYAACMAEIAVIYTERLGSPWFATKYRCIVDPDEPIRFKSFMWMRPWEAAPYGWYGFNAYYWVNPKPFDAEKNTGPA